MCSLACSDDRVCEGLAEDAQCLPVAQSSVEGSCTGTESVCDVECVRDDDCSSLGAAFECVERRCREGDDASDVLDDGNPSPSAICDGSDDIRLRYRAGGGLTYDTAYFTAPYGAFFIVDGHCHFYVSDYPRYRILEGTLSTADSEQLAADIQWSRLDALDFSDQACADSGEIRITKPGASAHCACGCDDGAPAGLAEAMDGAEAWFYRLARSGTPLTSPVTAVARNGAGRSGDFSATWPLARHIAEIDGLMEDPVQGLVGVSFHDADESAELRALRQAAPDGPTDGEWFVGVRDQGASYALFIVDRLPADVVDRVDALVASSEPKSPFE